MTELFQMELGQAVDYVIEYNDLHNPRDAQRSQEGPTPQADRPTIRKATQADWDAFWG